MSAAVKVNIAELKMPSTEKVRFEIDGIDGPVAIDTLGWGTDPKFNAKMRTELKLKPSSPFAGMGFESLSTEAAALKKAQYVAFGNGDDSYVTVKGQIIVNICEQDLVQCLEFLARLRNGLQKAPFEDFNQMTIDVLTKFKIGEIVHATKDWLQDDMIPGISTNWRKDMWEPQGVFLSAFHDAIKKLTEEERASVLRQKKEVEESGPVTPQLLDNIDAFNAEFATDKKTLSLDDCIGSKTKELQWNLPDVSKNEHVVHEPLVVELITKVGEVKIDSCWVRMALCAFFDGTPFQKYSAINFHAAQKNRIWFYQPYSSDKKECSAYEDEVKNVCELVLADDKENLEAAYEQLQNKFDKTKSEAALLWTYNDIVEELALFCNASRKEGKTVVWEYSLMDPNTKKSDAKFDPKHAFFFTNLLSVGYNIEGDLIQGAELKDRALTKKEFTAAVSNKRKAPENSAAPNKAASKMSVVSLTP